MRGDYSLSDIRAVTDGNNGGFGDNSAWWVIILIILFGWGRNGYGYGSNDGSTNNVKDMYTLNSDFATIQRQLSDGFGALERKGDSINNGLCDGFYAQNTTLLNGFSGVNSNISNGVYNLTNAITTSGFETRNAITQDTIANMQNTNALQSQISTCCCDLKGQLADNKYETAKGFCSTNNTIAMSVRDIIDNQNANYQKLHEEIFNNRLADKETQIQMQQNEINALRLSASQSAQNEYLLNSLRTGCPVHATLYNNSPVPVQYVTAGCGCNCNQGCGCNM